MEEHWKTLKVRPVEEDFVERERSLIHIEHLKLPYKYAMLEEWERMKEFFEHNPRHLLSNITMDGGTVFHLAASCSNKSQGKNLLEMVINILRCNPNICDVKTALMKQNNTGNTTLHEVSVTGNEEAAKYLMKTAHEEKYELQLLEARNCLGETSLFSAAAFGFTDLVKFYVGKLEKSKQDQDDIWKHFHRNDKTSILHIAVVAQHFETALWLVDSNPYLAPLKDNKGLTSLQLLAQMPAAFVPHVEQSTWKMLIYYCLPVGDVVTPSQGDNVESSRKEDVESSMKDEYVTTPNQEDDVESSMKDEYVTTPKQQKNDVGSSKEQKNDVESSKDSNQPHPQSIFRNKLADIGGLIWEDKKNKKALEKLIPLLAKWDKSWCTIDAKGDETISLGSEKKGDDDGGKKGKAAVSDKTNGDDGGEKEEEAANSEKLNKDGHDGGEKGRAAASDKINGDHGGGNRKELAKSKKEARNSSPLLIATITGILPIVKEILDQHPQAIEHINDNKHNILHLAIKYRRKEILDLIQSIPYVMPRLNKRIDDMGNTILHQAADRSYYSISLSQQLLGPVMQLQDELRWMLRVKEIIPPHYTLHHNSDDQTAEELFYQEHNKLLEEAQKWVKETAQSCSTVAVLVATVVFAAAYTIPGGNDEKGRPIFEDNPLFLLFTCMDAVAIACSLSSVAFFLSILTCPLEYPLFVDNIPRKVMAGFIFLFLSMATTMLAFAATILLLIRVKKKWTMSILYPIAFLPVPLFGLLQFPMHQSFMIMLKTINAWFFKPLLVFKSLLVFKPLLAFLGFPGFRRAIWSESRANQIT